MLEVYGSCSLPLHGLKGALKQITPQGICLGSAFDADQELTGVPQKDATAD